MNTESVLASMLTENTGRSILDSGGAYGRHWQRNAGRDFAHKPVTTTSFSIHRDGRLEVSISHNVYQWLDARVCYDAKMQRRFNRFAKRADNESKNWLEVMEAFPEYLGRRHKVAGLYPNERGAEITIYTANYDSCLSQDIQFCYFHVDGEPLYLLQIHGGCDVRGGLTAPRCFSEGGVSDQSLFEYGRCSLWAKTPDGKRTGPNWSNESGGWGRWHPGEYEAYLPLFGKTDWPTSPDLDSYSVTDDESKLGDGVHLVVTAAGRAFLPSGAELIGGD